MATRNYEVVRVTAYEEERVEGFLTHKAASALAKRLSRQDNATYIVQVM